MNEPKTVDGMAIYALSMRPGLMVRAGFSGVAVGFDWSAALALAAIDGVQPGCASFLLSRIESGALSGLKDRSDGTDK